MISFIVSSYNPKNFEQFSKSLNETIRQEYEIIKIDNPGKIGLSEVYNKGAELAKYNYVCFLHEDIIFQSCSWETALIKKFEADEQTGLIGVAGSSYKTLAPGMGWFNNKKELDYLNILQRTATAKHAEYQSQIKHDFEAVASLDGVFLFTKKSIWKAIKFDDKNFKNFHFYDLDFSLRVSLNYKVFVTNHVLIEHFSAGNYGTTWQTENLIFTKKWRNILPIGQLTKKEQVSLEWENKQWFLNKSKASGASFQKLLKLYFSFGFFKFFSINKSYKTAALIFKSFIFK